MTKPKNLTARWNELEKNLLEKFGSLLNMEAIIFLIGIRELGAQPHREFSKEEKVDLMHIALCKLLSQSGYYELSHLDQEGWPHWNLIKPLPHTDMFSQVALMKEHVLSYFEEEEIFGE